MIKNEEKQEKVQKRRLEEGKGETSSYQYSYNENGRMDTMGGDDYDDYNSDEDPQQELEELKDNQIEVDMN